MKVFRLLAVGALALVTTVGINAATQKENVKIVETTPKTEVVKSKEEPQTPIVEKEAVVKETLCPNGHVNCQNENCIQVQNTGVVNPLVSEEKPVEALSDGFVCPNGNENCQNPNCDGTHTPKLDGTGYQAHHNQGNGNGQHRGQGNGLRNGSGKNCLNVNNAE
ncbi:MAG: hypothetical protein RSC10_09835 [Longicatena sp.]